MDSIQLQYEGYLKTPLLWKNRDILGLQQLELQIQSPTKFKESIPDHIRLGKRVERFVSAVLNQHENIEILLENAQIKHDKITIGEIDCILKQNGVPVHLEIIYKFYLYDPQCGTNEMDHWVGPNRKDSLVQKLNKLKDKQLPLIYKEQVKQVLDVLYVKSQDIVQRVCFKAQLFMPYQANNDDLILVNKDCVKGFYINYADIGQFSHCQFHIPTKANWLIEIQAKVDWISFLQFKDSITPQILEKRAPLCWIRHPDGFTEKIFVVWWSRQ